MIGNFSVELAEHFWRSFAETAKFNLAHRLFARAQHASHSRRNVQSISTCVATCGRTKQPHHRRAEHERVVVRVAIIDYGVGNLRSVEKAFAATGCEAMVTGDETELRKAERLVLPGVGAFAACMKALSERGFDRLVQERGEKRNACVGCLCRDAVVV